MMTLRNESGALDLDFEVERGRDDDDFLGRVRHVETRADAEMLVVMDHANPQSTSEWTAFFVETITEYLVWRERPTGRISESDLDWLIGIAADAPSPSMPALLFALVREAEQPSERLIALALKHDRRRLIGSSFE